MSSVSALIFAKEWAGESVTFPQELQVLVEPEMLAPHLGQLVCVIPGFDGKFGNDLVRCRLVKEFLWRCYRGFDDVVELAGVERLGCTL